MEGTQLSRNERDTFAKEVVAHAHRAALGRLCFDVLSRQAEGRALFLARDWLDARVREQHVLREEAEVSIGNLLVILERGPSSSREHGLIAAFAVDGFAAIAEADASEASLERFLRHADWLERATKYSLFAFVDMLLPSAVLARFWKALVADLILNDEAPTPAERARRAALLTVLAQSKDARAAAGLVDLADNASDPAVRALAHALAPAAHARKAPTVGGIKAPRARGAFVELVRVFTGIALVSWAIRILTKVLGIRRRYDIELGATELRIETTLLLLGRTIRARKSVVPLRELRDAARAARYPYLGTLVGVLIFCIAAVVGGVFLIESLRFENIVAAAVAVAIIFAGGLLDFTFHTVAAGRRGDVVMTLRFVHARTISFYVRGADDADAWLLALAERLPQGQ